MRILYKDAKKGKIKLKIENLNDLWYLRNLINTGDFVSGITYRREEKIIDKLRPERREKKKMVLGLRVDKVEFHDFSDVLRVHGKIEEGPINLGSYHTLGFNVGDSLTIVKEWSTSSLAQLEDAIRESKQPKVILLGIDYGEVTLALLHSYGVEYAATISSPVSGKYYPTKERREDFYNEVLVKLKSLKHEEPIIILGPGFAKEQFFRFLKERDVELSKDCFVESASSAGIAGINEVLKKGFSVRVLQNTRVAVETQLVEKLFEELAKNGNCAYGEKEVKAALDYGTVETLLIVDKFVRAGKAEELFKLAKSVRAKPVIISTVHEAGKKLESLGGVGALLRYKISY